MCQATNISERPVSCVNDDNPSVALTLGETSYFFAAPGAMGFGMGITEFRLRNSATLRDLGEFTKLTLTLRKGTR